MIEKLEIDLEKLLSSKLKLEEYFILFCVFNDDQELLVRYTSITPGIPTNLFYKLRDSGFIILQDELTITYSGIKLTKQSIDLFNNNGTKQFDSLFIELLSVYPNKVKRITGSVRRLHNDLNRCKKLYKQCLVSPTHNVNVDLHQKIIKCVQLYYKEHLKDNKQEFMQLLATFLSQKTWEQYLDDIDKLDGPPQINNDYDAI